MRILDNPTLQFEFRRTVRGRAPLFRALAAAAASPCAALVLNELAVGRGDRGSEIAERVEALGLALILHAILVALLHRFCFPFFTPRGAWRVRDLLLAGAAPSTVLLQTALARLTCSAALCAVAAPGFLIMALWASVPPLAVIGALTLAWLLVGAVPGPYEVDLPSLSRGSDTGSSEPSAVLDTFGSVPIAVLRWIYLAKSPQLTRAIAPVTAEIVSRVGLKLGFTTVPWAPEFILGYIGTWLISPAELFQVPLAPLFPLMALFGLFQWRTLDLNTERLRQTGLSNEIGAPTCSTGPHGLALEFAMGALVGLTALGYGWQALFESGSLGALVGTQDTPHALSAFVWLFGGASILRAFATVGFAPTRPSARIVPRPSEIILGVGPTAGAALMATALSGIDPSVVVRACAGLLTVAAGLAGTINAFNAAERLATWRNVWAGVACRCLWILLLPIAAGGPLLLAASTQPPAAAHRALAWSPIYVILTQMPGLLPAPSCIPVGDLPNVQLVAGISLAFLLGLAQRSATKRGPGPRRPARPQRMEENGPRAVPNWAPRWDRERRLSRLEEILLDDSTSSDEALCVLEAARRRRRSRAPFWEGATSCLLISAAAGAINCFISLVGSRVGSIEPLTVFLLGPTLTAFQGLAGVMGAAGGAIMWPTGWSDFALSAPSPDRLIRSTIRVALARQYAAWFGAALGCVCAIVASAHFGLQPSAVAVLGGFWMVGVAFIPHRLLVTVGAVGDRSPALLLAIAPVIAVTLTAQTLLWRLGSGSSAVVFPQLWTALIVIPAALAAWLIALIPFAYRSTRQQVAQHLSVEWIERQENGPQPRSATHLALLQLKPVADERLR